MQDGFRQPLNKEGLVVPIGLRNAYFNDEGNRENGILVNKSLIQALVKEELYFPSMFSLDTREHAESSLTLPGISLIL